MALRLVFGEAKIHQFCCEDEFAALRQYKAQNGDCSVLSLSEVKPKQAE